jgi:hypothetical protein
MITPAGALAQAQALQCRRHGTARRLVVIIIIQKTSAWGPQNNAPLQPKFMTREFLFGGYFGGTIRDHKIPISCE